MIVNLLSEPQLRGYMLEYVAKVLLRRSTKNNFIFLVQQFDSVGEIISKYRLDCSGLPAQADFLMSGRCRADIIAFTVDSVTARKVTGIQLYDVKSTIHSARKEYFEYCVSNHEYAKCALGNGLGVFVVSLVLFEQWKLIFNIFSFEKVSVRRYTRHVG